MFSALTAREQAPATLWLCASAGNVSAAKASIDTAKILDVLLTAPPPHLRRPLVEGGAVEMAVTLPSGEH
jgi:hypothetical protein